MQEKDGPGIGNLSARAEMRRAYQSSVTQPTIQCLVIDEHFNIGRCNLCPIENRGNGLDRGLLHVERASKGGVGVDEEPCVDRCVNHGDCKNKRRGEVKRNLKISTFPRWDAGASVINRSQ